MGRRAADLEKKKIPTVLAVWDLKEIIPIVKREVENAGVPELRMVFTTPSPDITHNNEFIPQFIDALTRPLTADEKKEGTYKAPAPPRIAMTGTYEEVQKYFEGDLSVFVDIPTTAKWTDGLPITPPTEAAVAKMLTGTSHSADEVVVPEMLPKGLMVTVEKVAINGVMAGCKPEHMPVLLAMAEHETAFMVGQPCAFGTLFVVSGPIAKEIGMSAGAEMLGAGNPANTSIGRCWALMKTNLGGVTIGVDGIVRIGNPLLRGFCIAESNDSPWETLNVSEGFKANESTLHKFSGLYQQNYYCSPGATPLNLDEVLVPTPDSLLYAIQHNGAATQSGILIIFSPECARTFAERYNFSTLQQLQDYLWDHATRNKKDWVEDYWFYVMGPIAQAGQRGKKMWNPDMLELPDDAQVPVLHRPEDIKILVGGAKTGRSWARMPCRVGGIVSRTGKPGKRAISIDKWR